MKKIFLLSSLFLFACGSVDNKTVSPIIPTNPNSQNWVVATYDGSYNAATGKLSLTPENASSSELTVDSFGVITRSSTSLVFVNVSNSGTNANCGDPSEGIVSQPNSFCAVVNIANGSNRPYSLVWSEFYQITTGFTVAGGFDDTVPSALNGILNAAVGDYNYGNINFGASTQRTWVFRTGGSTSNFSFKVQIKAAPTRTAYTATSGKLATFTNACNLPNNTAWILSGDDFDTANGIPAPFPLTVYNLSGITYNLSVKGSFSVDDSLSGNGTNTGLPTNTMPSGTVFPYWADQRTRLGGSDLPLTNNLNGNVCSAVEGTYPNQILDITWSNTVLDSNPNNDSNLVYSLRYYEANDEIEFQYNMLHDLTTSSWPNPLTVSNQTLSTRSLGGSATIGFQGITNGNNCSNPDLRYCLLGSVNTPASFLPNAVSQYPHYRRYIPSGSN